MSPEVNRDSVDQLERRVDDLIAMCRRLQKENAALQADHGELKRAHDALRDRAQRARTRVESVISRLKALERSEHV